MKYYIALILSVTAMQSWATVYMHEDAEGNITYSDTPENNAQPITVTPTTTLPSTTAPATSAVPASTTVTTTETTESEADYYHSFSIISPANNDTIQNQPIISVKLATEPEFRAGDTIQVYLDGQPWGKPVASTTVTMENVERGEHSIYARLLDSAQNTLKQTDSVKIFVHRASSNFKTSMNEMNGKTKLVDLLLKQ